MSHFSKAFGFDFQHQKMTLLSGMFLVVYCFILMSQLEGCCAAGGSGWFIWLGYNEFLWFSLVPNLELKRKNNLRNAEDKQCGGKTEISTNKPPT